MDPGEDSVSCDIRKDAGNGPDVTDRPMVHSQIRLPDTDSGDAGCAGGNYVYGKDGLQLYLPGGVGVGMVTQCGLSCEVGRATINPVPRRMISEQVAGVCWKSGFKDVLSIKIRVPGAFEVTHRTFNNRLGIRGGIPILGISGIVELMNKTALLDTMWLELRQGVRRGEKNLLVIPRNYGESFVGNILRLGLGQAMKCSNFASSTIGVAMEEGAESVLLIGHGGRLVKLAAGIMNTYPSWTDGGMGTLAAHGAACGAEKELVEQILEAMTMDGGPHLLGTENGLRERVVKRVTGRLEQHVKRRAGESLRAEAIVFINERGVLGATTGTGDLFICLTDRTRNRWRAE